MTQPEGIVVPPASIRRPLFITLLFGGLFVWAVAAFVSNWTFSPALRNDLLVGSLAAAAAITGTVFYLALGAVILDVGQPQLTVDDKGIKSPAYPRMAWQDVDGVIIRKRGGLGRHDSELEIKLSEDASTSQRMSLWQRLRQRKALANGTVVLTGQAWPLEQLQETIENHLAWHRNRTDDLQRKLVRYMGDRVPGESRRRVA